MTERRTPNTERRTLNAVPDWVADAVFYQIFPDRFAKSERVPKPGSLEPWTAPPTRHGFKGGDLLGVVEHLDYLDSLGINAIYLNPIFSSASNHRYHAYDYLEVDPLLGGDAAFKELLNAAHERGMRIILDGVFNHASRGFWPFHHILENGPESPYVDWFFIKGWPLHAYSPRRKPNYEAWWDLHALPKLNVRHPEAREYLLGVAEHWSRLGIDGWRLDVPQEIDDAEFWRSFRRRVRAARPESYLVGEIWKEAPEWLAGDRFDALMNYPFSRTALGFCARQLSRRIRPGGHELRPLTAAAARDEMQHQLDCYDARVVRSQLNLLVSHDTERTLTIMGGDHTGVHLATLLQMTMPGAPCIYYGDEIGMEGNKDPDCRRAFPWDESTWHGPSLDLFRRAISLRKEHGVLRRGDFEFLYSEKKTLAFLRWDDAESLAVIINAGGRDCRLQIDADALKKNGPTGSDHRRAVELLSTSDQPSRLTFDSKGTLKVALPQRTGIVVKIG